MNMEIDEPRGQIKTPGVDILVRLDGSTLPNSCNETRLKAHPSWLQHLFLENYPGVMNTSHDVPLVWSVVSCKGRDRCLSDIAFCFQALFFEMLATSDPHDPFPKPGTFQTENQSRPFV
jgi:hypothetical protein